MLHAAARDQHEQAKLTVRITITLVKVAVTQSNAAVLRPLHLPYKHRASDSTSSDPDHQLAQIAASKHKRQGLWIALNPWQYFLWHDDIPGL